MAEHSLKKLWQPSAASASASTVRRYMTWLESREGIELASYDDLWRWSVEDVARFWESLWEYFDVQSQNPYTDVLVGTEMPEFSWFPGATLNYAEHIFRNETQTHPALILDGELRATERVSWQALRDETAALQSFLRDQGVTAGDRVVAYLPAIREAVVGLLATSAMGVTWSSCSPDFGTDSVIDRFKQVSPKVLLAVDGYRYGGRPFDRREEVRKLCEALPSLERVILVPYLSEAYEVPAGFPRPTTTWADATSASDAALQFVPVAFEHPLWILYSSGTTGIPKAITHGHGGIVLEHLKLHHLHHDLQPGDPLFWMSTTGWVMWNIVTSALLTGATAVYYDGNPGLPDLNRLWQLVSDNKVRLFGSSAGFLISYQKSGLVPAGLDLDALRCIASTGSPLPAETFEWLYDNVKPDVWLNSTSGGTDVASGFVGGSPLLPVYSGEIQCRLLGVDVHSYSEDGQPQIDEVGEMVIAQPMPSMPVCFWNDPDKARYRASYFDNFPGKWRHGDWMRVSELGTVEISGRSDSTLNRLGVRIGTSEIYRAVDSLPEVIDSLVVGLELPGGRYYMPLFVQLPEDQSLDAALIDRIKQNIRTTCSPRHVPDDIVQIPEVPYTLSGKKLETPVKRLLLGGALDEVVKVDATRSPGAMDFFVAFARQSGLVDH